MREQFGGCRSDSDIPKDHIDHIDHIEKRGQNKIKICKNYMKMSKIIQQNKERALDREKKEEYNEGRNP